MQNILARLALVLPSVALTACPDEGRRPIGSSCDDGVECTSGLCLANLCVDPDGDEDGDNLLNHIEIALGSNPLSGDSDGDGIDDATEFGSASVARDTDGDGLPDLVESGTADGDGDCIPDQQDPANDTADPNGCGAVGDTTGGDGSDEPDTGPNDVASDGDPGEIAQPTDAVAEVLDDVGPDPDVGPPDDTTVIESRCETPTNLVASAAGLEASFPLLAENGDGTTWLVFQQFQRIHHAMSFDGNVWSTPENFMSGYDMNPTVSPDICRNNGIITACRGETLDTGGNGVLAVHRVGGIGWLPLYPVDGIGAGTASHDILDRGRVIMLTSRDGGLTLELTRWSAEGGVGTPTTLGTLTADAAVDTSLEIDGLGNGAAIAVTASGNTVVGYPIVDSLPAGEPVALSPTGTDRFSSDLRAAQLPTGGVVAVWNESARRIALSIFTHVDGVGAFSDTEIVHDGEAAFQSVSVAPDGGVYVTFTSNQRDFVRHRAADGTWSETVDLGTMSGRSVKTAFSLDGAPWIATQDPDDGRMRVVRANPGTADFQPVFDVPRPADVSSWAQLAGAASPDGGVMFVWQHVDGAGIGATWTRCR